MMVEPVTPDEQSATRRLLGTAAWLLCSLLVVGLVLGTWMRVRDERGAQDLAARIATGDRPAAPALPTAVIPDDGAPGLPVWYRADGDTQRGDARGGRVLVVNFWASWCGPCEDEAPELRELSEEYAGRVVVVGVDMEDLEREARAFVRRHRLTFPIVRGDRADKEAWGIRGYPETFVVGVDGRIAAHNNGPIDVEALRAAVDAELGRS